MNANINISLVNDYILTTGNDKNIYQTLLLNCVEGLVADDVTKDLINLCPLFLATVAASRQFENYKVNIWKTTTGICAVVCENEKILFGYRVNRNDIILQYLNDSSTMSELIISDFKKVDISQEFVCMFVATSHLWDTSVDRAMKIIDYIEVVGDLLNSRGSTDIHTTLQETLETKSSELKRIDEIIRFRIPGGKTEEKTAPSYSKPEEPQIVETTTPFDAQEIITELTLFANVINKQTKTGVVVTSLADGEITFSVGNTVQRLYPTSDEGRMLTIASNKDTGISTSKEVITCSTREEFVRTFLEAVSSQSTVQVHHDVGGDIKAVQNFIVIILNIMTSGTSPNDIHLPGEVTSSPSVEEDSELEKRWKLGREHYEETLNQYTRNGLVKLFLSLKHSPVENIEDVETAFDNKPEFNLTCFPALISLAYADQLINKAEKHSEERLISFVTAYVEQLVSVNWDPEALADQTISKLTNRKDWVTTYSIDTILNKLLHKVDNFPSLIDVLDDKYNIPESTDIATIRKHFLNNPVLETLNQRVTTFRTGDTETHYVRIQEEREFTDMFITVIEIKSDRIRVVPMTYSTKNNVVDSINIFKSIRESEWPSILTYLAKNLDLN